MCRDKHKFKAQQVVSFYKVQNTKQLSKAAILNNIKLNNVKVKVSLRKWVGDFDYIQLHKLSHKIQTYVTILNEYLPFSVWLHDVLLSSLIQKVKKKQNNYRVLSVSIARRGC